MFWLHLSLGCKVLLWLLSVCVRVIRCIRLRSHNSTGNKGRKEEATGDPRASQPTQKDVLVIACV